MNKRKGISSEPPSTDVTKPVPQTLSADELLAAGKSLRRKVLRQAHGAWKRPVGRADPLAILRASDAGRLSQLLPIRYGRMLQTPFTFYRGAAAVMAAAVGIGQAIAPGGQYKRGYKTLDVPLPRRRSH